MGVGHVVSGLLGLMSTLTAWFEKNLDQFSGVRTGNPWTVTFGNGVRKVCYLQGWEHTTLPGSSTLPAQL